MNKKIKATIYLIYNVGCKYWDTKILHMKEKT